MDSVFLYSSEVTIVADDVTPMESGTSDIEKYSLAKLNAANTARLYRQAYSDEMISFLDSALKLGEHYKIARNEEYASKLFYRIYKRLKIEKIDFNVTTIRFKDHDRFLTAKAVNLVYEKLRSINRNYLYSAMRRKSYVYAGLISKLNRDNFNQVATLKEIFENENANKIMATRNDELKISVLKSLAQIEQNNSNLKDAEQIVAWSTEAIADTSLQNIWLINKGKVPDAVSNWIKIIGASAILASLAVAVFITISYFVISHKHYIKLLLKGK
ncbi:MAG TPA: hypothetical protein PKN75_06030 [Bacteroidia bacterium]|nr:hypothetical protein [Bacteroidia bacterium]